MKIEYKCKKVEQIALRDQTKPNLPQEVIKPLKEKLAFLNSARDERDIRNFKSLNYEKLKGDKRGYSSIRLNGKWRLILNIISSEAGQVIVVYGVEDYH